MSEDKTWFEKVQHWFNRVPESTAELIELLREVCKEGVVDANALMMLEGVLEVSELTVSQILVPRTQMTSLCVTEKPEDFIARVTESGHSRFPVFDAKYEHVIGVLLAKDLLPLLVDPSKMTNFDFEDYVRTVMVVPETKRLESLLQAFRQTSQHMAVAVDEYGSVVGLVTIEDILEQIVGDIADESDTEEDQGYTVKPQADGSFVVKAMMPLHEFNEYFATQYPEQSAANTIGGFLMAQAHRVPRKGEVFHLGDFTFTVLRADYRRLYLLSVKPSE
ncbi:MAG: magnesium/cobalt efflux protein [Gammaproteobacteria bacterium]|jgi:magnesium and cobalt transporter|nr:magnesium/cobalt efflux protein [Gammaproteobacteria bacterium]